MKKLINFVKHEDLSPKQRLVSCLYYFPLWALAATIYAVVSENISKKNESDISSAPVADNIDEQTIESLCKTNKHNIQVTCWIRSFLAIVVLILSLFGIRKFSEYMGGKYDE